MSVRKSRRHERNGSKIVWIEVRICKLRPENERGCTTGL